MKPLFLILALCLLGACAALLGLRSLDRWCAGQLTDSPTTDL